METKLNRTLLTMPFKPEENLPPRIANRLRTEIENNAGLLFVPRGVLAHPEEAGLAKGKNWVVVEFVESGFCRAVTSDKLKNGMVSDKTSPKKSARHIKMHAHSDVLYKRFKNKAGQWFTITRTDGRDKAGNLFFVAEFEESGCIKRVRKSNIKTGLIRDDIHPVNPKSLEVASRTDLIVGETLENSKGLEFLVLRHNEDDRSRFDIQFLETGYETTVRKDSIMNGKVRDYWRRDYCGVACAMLPPDHPLKNMEHHDSLVRMYRHMVDRCYKEDYPAYQSYGAKGVRVHPSWLDLAGYLQTVTTLPNWDKASKDFNNWHLDKDLLTPPGAPAIYGPDTCLWVPRSLNNFLAKSKPVTIGDKLYLTSTEACKDLKITSTTLVKALQVGNLDDKLVVLLSTSSPSVRSELKRRFPEIDGL